MTAFVFLTVGWRIAGILLLVTGLLVAMQPRISYRIAERDVTAELYQALPQMCIRDSYNSGTKVRQGRNMYFF